MVTIYVVAKPYLVESKQKPKVTVEEIILNLYANDTTCRVGERIKFFGNLTKNGSPMSGQIVRFYCNSINVENATTSVDGTYSIIWTAITKGLFEFHTEVELA